MTKRKIGIFSGTFDPVHDGHVWFVDMAIEELGLDEVLILVEASPRRKKGVTELALREQMAHLAFADNPKVKVNHLDATLVGLSHDVRTTLAEIQKYSKDSELWLMMGGDVFEFVPRWHNFEELIKSVNFFVALRSEDDGEIAVELMNDQLADATVKLVASEQSAISSSKIRLAIQSSEEPKGLNESVYEFIKDEQLYR